jgi:toxin FitB
MRFLLDANVLSEGVRTRPDSGVANWLVQNESRAAISELTIGELTKGAFLLPAGPKRRRILSWITEVEIAFDDRVLALSRDVLKKWGQLCGTHEAQGRRWPVLDSLLAATALFHDLTIVTRNTADFLPEVRTFNPWKK